MEARTLPLLLASDHFASPGETQPLDRLRMQKGVFLLVMRGPKRWQNLFNFAPYDWGPYSADLARTVNELADEGLLDKEPVPGRQYHRYRTTDEGELEVALELSALDSREVDFIIQVRRYVNSRSFNQLLREVYSAYPDYAVNSRFSG